MRFRLVYHGNLPASGNSPKPDSVQGIRDQFHPQLKLLWETHLALKTLRQNAIVQRDPALHRFDIRGSPFLPQRDLELYPARAHEINLCEPIARGTQRFMPLVRKSLDLNCELNIIFLRKEDPGALLLQAGDLDNRIKLLFDALKVPSVDAVNSRPQKQDTTYCLMEEDSLIYRFEVDSDRLLFPETEKREEVYLIIEVIVRVLRVGEWNMALLGN